MKKTLAVLFLLTATWSVATLAARDAVADDVTRENRSVDASASKVHLGGTVHLVMHQGTTPLLLLSGERSDLAKVTTVQRGDTLSIEMRDNVHFSGRHPEIRADLTLPNLQEFVSNGVGPSELSGFTGNRLAVSLEGAGAVQVAGQYRDVDARLGGVGSLTLNPGKAERIELHLGGAGQITVTGQTKVLRAHLGGVGSLDAQQLQADNVELDMSGMGGANVYARTAANVSLSGMGSATVYGKPATRNATTNGFGKVSWQ